MFRLDKRGTLEDADVACEKLFPLIPQRIRTRRTRLLAPAHQRQSRLITQRGFAANGSHRSPMYGEGKLIQLLLPVHAQLSSGGPQTASRSSCATRFIAACSDISRPRRLSRKSACSALTITPSKKASTGSRSAASVCSEAV